jgi:hypothetical protein
VFDGDAQWSDVQRVRDSREHRSGAFGAVYRAHQSVIDREVAIKDLALRRGSGRNRAKNVGPQQPDFQVLFIVRHTTDCDHIQHEFADQQEHTKEHLPLPLRLPARQRNPPSTLSLRGFSRHSASDLAWSITSVA